MTEDLKPKDLQDNKPYLTKDLQLRQNTSEMHELLEVKLSS